MVIDQKSKDMIDLLINSEPDGPRKSFSYGYICEISHMDADDMFPIVKNLISSGYAEYAYSNSKTFGQKDRGIALTQRGLKYEEYQKLESGARWKERIFGFFAGVITTSLGVLLQHLLT